MMNKVAVVSAVWLSTSGKKKQIGELRVWKNRRGCCPWPLCARTLFSCLTGVPLDTIWGGRGVNWGGGAAERPSQFLNLGCNRWIDDHRQPTVQQAVQSSESDRAENMTSDLSSMSSNAQRSFSQTEYAPTPWVLKQLYTGEFRKMFEPNGLGGSSGFLFSTLYFWERPFPHTVELLWARVSS